MPCYKYQLITANGYGIFDSSWKGNWIIFSDEARLPMLLLVVVGRPIRPHGVNWFSESNIFLLHCSRFPDNILNYIKRSSLVRTFFHIKASLPLPRARVTEDRSQQRADRANPSKSWAMMTYSFFSFSLLVQRSLVILRADWSSRPQTIKVPFARSKIQFQLIFLEQDICGMESTALSIVICWLDNKAEKTSMHFSQTSCLIYIIFCSYHSNILV